MKVFVTGATGAIGAPLVAQLVDAGHEVVGLVRSPEKARRLHDAGAEAAIGDVLDREAVHRAVAGAEPEVIVHQATSFGGSLRPKHVREAFAVTSRLRSEGTDHLLAAGRVVGIRRFIAQGNACPGIQARVGGPVKTEDDPVDLDPPARLRPGIEALRHLEAAVTGIDWADGLVLRYGAFYGPGTSTSADPDAFLTRQVLKRRMPLVGDGGSVFSHVHVEDAASATVAALDHGGTGIYNVADDEPAPMREWLPYLAEQLGAGPPRRVPAWLVRLVAGETALVMATRLRGVSNAKARRELDWQPRWPSWRLGFAKGLG